MNEWRHFLKNNPLPIPPLQAPICNLRTERVQCQEIKACYLRLQGSFFSLLLLHPLFRPSLCPFLLFRDCRVGGAWGGGNRARGGVFLTLIKAGRGGGWVDGGVGGEASLMTGIHSPFLIHLSPSFTLSCLPSFTTTTILPFPLASASPRALVIIGEVLVTANEITI